MLKSIQNPSIGSGELVHKVDIQKPRTAPGDTFGQSMTPDDWDTVLTVRAAVEPTGAGETSEPGLIVGQISHRVTIRWTPTFIGANYRVLFGARVFTVQGVTDLLERRRVLVLFCNEVNQQTK